MRAAGAEAGLSFALVVELHGQTDDFVARLGQQRGGDGRVHAARHGDDDSHEDRDSSRDSTRLESRPET